MPTSKYNHSIPQHKKPDQNVVKSNPVFERQPVKDIKYDGRK